MENEELVTICKGARPDADEHHIKRRDAWHPIDPALSSDIHKNFTVTTGYCDDCLKEAEERVENN